MTQTKCSPGKHRSRTTKRCSKPAVKKCSPGKRRSPKTSRCKTSTQIFCLKCQSKTQTTSLKHVVTANNHNAIRGKCAVCGTNKFQFVKK